MHIRNIDKHNTKEFAKYMSDSGAFIFVYHPQCGHCIAMKPAWKKLKNTARTLPHEYQLISIHADALPHIKKQFTADGFPTLLSLHRHGRPHREYKGDRSYEDLLRFLKRHLGKLSKPKSLKAKGGSKAKTQKEKGKKEKQKKAKKTKKRIRKIANGLGWAF
jgi:thioredoxin-like negative regulator of GroEL